MIRLPRRRLLTGAAALAAYAALGREAHALSPTTWNPADATATLSNGNLTATTSGGGTQLGARSSFSSGSGKWYFEIWGSNLASGGGFTSFGLSPASVSFANIQNHGAGVFGWYATGGVYLNNSLKSTIDTYASANNSQSAAMQAAFDFGGELAWFRNSLGSTGEWNASATANPATGVGGISFSALSGPWFIYAAPTPNNGVISFTADFGATSFHFTPPSGFQSGFGMVPAGGDQLSLLGAE